MEHRNYSEKKIKKIIKGGIVVPQKVEDQMQQAYTQLGAETRVVHFRRPMSRKRAVLAACVAALAIGTVGIAANGYFHKTLKKEEGKATYLFDVEHELTPYDVEMRATWLPEGFVLQEEGAFSGKIQNTGTGAGIYISALNAANIDEGREDYAKFVYNHVTDIEETRINEMEANILTIEAKGEKKRQLIWMFNEAEGYIGEVQGFGEVSKEDLIKVAEKAEIKKLDTQLAWKSEEEKAAGKAERDAAESIYLESYLSGVSKENVYKSGEEVKNPSLKENADSVDLRYTVTGVKVFDKISLEDYPPEYFRAFEEQLSSQLNEDGSLKLYERISYSNEDQWAGKEEVREKTETVGSKFVEVKMKVKNMEDAAEEGMIAPPLTNLTPKADGNYAWPAYNSRAAYEDTENLHSRPGAQDYSSTRAIYMDMPVGVEGEERWAQHFDFRTLKAKEELEYTLLYVVDEDGLENMCLQFWNGEMDGENPWDTVQCYVSLDE